MKREQPLLYSLDLPKDLKTLCKQDMEQLATEIRSLLMEIKDECGGHLASNLGVVELTIALHAVFDSPQDQLVWDVSHQCYVHKILTDRLDRMLTIKKHKGISGFAKIAESPFDSWGAGHASTAISAGLGMAQARDRLQKKFSVVSIVGDGSLSGGMCFEALNNIDQMKGNFICILNDNNMSISPPVGSMAKHITSIRTMRVYDSVKSKFERIFEKIPKIGVPLKRRIEKMVERMRSTIIDTTKMGVMFEEFGFKYLGPLDGHNIPLVMAALKYAKTYPGPIMVHLMTKKGKGYAPAEEDPVRYHGVSPKPAPNAHQIQKPKTYTQIFGDSVIDIASSNKRVVVITPAMREGSGLIEYETQFPDRYFDVGIAEEHAVTFAGGLSKCGIIPILAIYSTFLQRGFDQLIHDICIQNLPLVLAIDRAGLVGSDGPTHHGVFDYSYLLLIPHMVVMAPKDGTELTAMLQFAVQSEKIVSIRYPRGGVPPEDGRHMTPISFGKSELLKAPSGPAAEIDALIIAAGSMVWPAFNAAVLLDEKDGLSTSVVNLRFAKPLDMDTILPLAKRAHSIVVIEEGSKIGGIHSYIMQELSSQLPYPCPPIHSISIPDQFIEHGSQKELLSSIDMENAEQLRARILRYSPSRV